MWLDARPVLDTVWWSQSSPTCRITSDDGVRSRFAVRQIRPEIASRAAISSRTEDALGLPIEFGSARTHRRWRWMERAAAPNTLRTASLHDYWLASTLRNAAVPGGVEEGIAARQFLATLAHECAPTVADQPCLHILPRAKPEQSARRLPCSARSSRWCGCDALLICALRWEIDLRCEPFDLALAIRDAVDTSAPSRATVPGIVDISTPPSWSTATARGWPRSLPTC